DVRDSATIEDVGGSATINISYYAIDATVISISDKAVVINRKIMEISHCQFKSKKKRKLKESS
ncbi:MAG: hypothetical protein KKH44_04200, partial [Bacteroidetes bacterium]|nr:hypothetical protein [Bacteroidota bacterium]